MITFITSLLLALSILAVVVMVAAFTIFIVGVGGGIFIAVFGDLIVFIGLIVLIVKLLRKRKKNKK